MTSSYSLDGLMYVQGEAKDVQLKKQPVVLELWATWCPPCRTSIPHINDLAAKYKGKVGFVGVSNEGESAVRKFVGTMGSKMAYPVACDTRGVTAPYSKEYKVQGIPHAFVIDIEGKVQWHGHPMDSQFESALEKVASQVPKIDLKGKSKEEVSALSVKQLKEALKQKNIDISTLLEKSELVDKAMQECV